MVRAAQLIIAAMGGVAAGRDAWVAAAAAVLTIAVCALLDEGRPTGTGGYGRSADRTTLRVVDDREPAAGE